MSKKKIPRHDFHVGGFLVLSQEMTRFYSPEVASDSDWIMKTTGNANLTLTGFP